MRVRIENMLNETIEQASLIAIPLESSSRTTARSRSPVAVAPIEPFGTVAFELMVELEPHLHVSDTMALDLAFLLEERAGKTVDQADHRSQDPRWLTLIGHAHLTARELFELRFHSKLDRSNEPGELLEPDCFTCT